MTTPIPKITKVRSKAIRKSARGETCTGRLPGCDHSGTVVFAHGPYGGGGARLKGHDFWGAYLCYTCHISLDQRHTTVSQFMETWLRAIAETQERLFQKGLLKL